MERSPQAGSLSQTDHTTPRPAIPVDKQRAMGEVLDRWRLNNGWNPLDDKTQMASIAAFVHELDTEKVPHQHYGELYSRALRSRIAAVQNGKQLPNFGVELMLAEWLGPHGLKKELQQREIDAGRTLTSNAASVCLKCDGTGMERVKDAQGRIGLRQGCDHEYTPAEAETMDGFDMVEAAIKRPSSGETAIQIVRRLRRELAREFVMSEHDQAKADNAWQGQRVLQRIEKCLTPQTAG